MNTSPKPNFPLARLFDTVVDGGYCIGCGVCPLSSSQISLTLNEYGRYQATWQRMGADDSEISNVLEVCPFSELAFNEDEISELHFSSECTYDSRIGYYLENYAGYAIERGFRENGSSGGITTWLLSELLLTGEIDYVIHVRPTVGDDRFLFSYAISATIEQIYGGAKSRYYPVEMSQVLHSVLEIPGRYALVGVPCFVKAARLLSLQNRVFAERIKYYVSLICGQLKSSAFAEYLAWQCGVKPSNLQDIDFRKKLEGRRADSYGVQIISKDYQEIVRPMSEMYDHSWGSGFFKYKACDYCDDIVGETADISIGDAWLPQYTVDGKGTNIIVVRNPIIRDLLETGLEKNRLSLISVSADDVVTSQQGAFNHRRLGLSYRLHLADRAGYWHPPKRVQSHPRRRDRRLRKVQCLRIQLAEASHRAWRKAVEAESFEVFVKIVSPTKEVYDKIYRKKQGPWWRRKTIRALRKIHRMIRR